MGGGSSNNTGGKGFVSTVLNPVSWIADKAGVESGKSTVLDPFGLGTLNPVDDMQTQAINNTSDWLSGKQEFGVHNNWFGNSAVGDTLNPMMGGQTESTQKAWDDYYKRKDTANKKPSKAAVAKSAETEDSGAGSSLLG